jgi:hypothetical protein
MAEFYVNDKKPKVLMFSQKKIENYVPKHTTNYESVVSLSS